MPSTDTAEQMPLATTTAEMPLVDSPAADGAALLRTPHLRIAPKRGWQVIDWRELLAYKDLFRFLVQRDVTVRYKQTVLGLGWAIIRPVFSMIVFTVVFGGLANVPSDGVPYAVFSFAALIPWTYFSTALTTSAASLVTNAQMVTKVYFPRLVIPATPVLGNLVDFAISFVVLCGMIAWFGIMPTYNVLFLPVLIVIMAMSALGAGLWLSALAIQYRDINQAMQFVVQLGMYAAPVVWPVSLITEKFPVWGQELRLVYALYPMAGVIEGFRASLLGTTAMPWDLILIGALSAAISMITGMYYFKRMERTFADVA